ncbi:MAG TPA: hybrid sensor histidine kinase/response regulator [Gemmatimonadales bacterium]|nr:hybrid sensor histidine kinase/response regulator [Gemmatimonadales bacterium]
MLDRFADPLIRTFGSLEALPPVWREILEGLDVTLAEAQDERDRLAAALKRTTTELHELLVELDALRRARSAAESTNLIRGEVLATLGRTMRTPADTILGLTGLLRTGALLPTQRAYVDAVNGAAHVLHRILSDVSDFSRLEGGTLPLEPIPFDLRVMVEDMASTLSMLAQAKGLSLRLAWRPDAPRRVTGDPGRIRQVLSSLVRDAVARIERGEILLEVGRGTMRTAQGGVRFMVEDTGPSIPNDLLATLFEPFSRGDLYPGRDGGLALPIARQLTHLMGGELLVVNVPEAGSRFTASLPLPVLEEPSIPRAPGFGLSELATAVPVLSGGGLLVVDADPDQRAAWVAIAEASGYQATGIESRDEAMAELHRRAAAGRAPAIVIFCDHDALGYEQIGREILERADLARPALIMLPAVGNPGDASRLRQAGFRGYLAKPVAPSDLRETLETLRRTSRGSWHTLFLTRHTLAEARRDGAAPEDEVNASLEQLIGAQHGAAGETRG